LAKSPSPNYLFTAKEDAGEKALQATNKTGKALNNTSY